MVQPPSPESTSVALADLLFESGSVGVAVLDRSLRYLRVNRALAAMNGRSSEDHVGRHVREVIPHGAADALVALLERVIGGGEAVTDMPVVVHMPGGAQRRFLASYHPVRERDGAISGIIGTVAEHTAPSTDETAWLNRQLFTLSPLPTWVYDRETLAFLDVNDAAIRRYGWTREEFLGRTLRDIRPPEDMVHLEAAAALPQPTPGSRGFFRHLTKSGELLDVEVFSQDFERAGRPAGIVVVQDVSEQRRAESSLRAAMRSAEQAREQAETANRGKSDFLATMSHELRTPLNAIQGYAELMELGIHGPVTPAQQEALRRIQTSQRHLLGLVNGVLNYARIETGNLHYTVSDVAVDAVLVTCEALIAPQATARGIALGIAPREERGAVPVVRADAEKLQQIVLNLLSNAVKFTEPGGRIDVAARATGATVVVEVRDTGLGIPADQLERIFEPFVQVDARLTRTHEGVGLGLAISRDLARGMGGDLTVRSEIGRGSTFTLSLPRA